MSLPIDEKLQPVCAWCARLSENRAEATKHAGVCTASPLVKRIAELEARVEQIWADVCAGESGAECTECGHITANGTCTGCRHGTSDLMRMRKAEAAVIELVAGLRAAARAACDDASWVDNARALIAKHGGGQ